MEAQRTLDSVLKHERKVAAQKQAEQTMEVFPRDARLVDPAVFERYFEPTPLPSDLIKSGRFWFHSVNLEGKGKRLLINSDSKHLEKDTLNPGDMQEVATSQVTEV